jgi:hypothetical protein
MHTWIKTHIAIFRAENQGSVSVEFMLILPLLFWWYAASFVFFDAFSANNKALKSSYMVSDILSRQTEIDNDYLDGLEGFLEFMTGVDSGTWMRVTSVQFSSADGYEVDWSYSTGSEEPLITSQLASLNLDDDYLPLMANGESVILAETYVPYNPGYDVGLLARTYSNVIVTRPRFASQIANTDF